MFCGMCVCVYIHACFFGNRHAMTVRDALIFAGGGSVGAHVVVEVHHAESQPSDGAFSAGTFDGARVAFALLDHNQSQTQPRYATINISDLVRMCKSQTGTSLSKHSCDQLPTAVQAIFTGITATTAND